MKPNEEKNNNADDSEEHLILIDKQDSPIGTCEKLQAHKQGLLHRAFSVFIFNDRKELLLQKRAKNKYHSGGLWSNTCCSHYRPDEDPVDAPGIRLREEMGFTCNLTRLFSFTYKVYIEKDQLFEHETDHVFIGTYNGTVVINHNEVENYAWVAPSTLLEHIRLTPEDYTYWFKELIEKVLQYI